MHFLLLCILSSTGIFVIFKSIDRQGIPAFPVIVINYLVATILGFAIHTGEISARVLGEAPWLPIGALIGILFIIMFFLVAFSTRKAGISITTVASKMSVVFPILFSLFIDPSDRLTFLKTAAIIVTLSGVGLSVYKPRKGRVDLAVMYIPVLLFLGMGMVDSLVKYAQHRFVGDSHTAIFSAVLFLNAFLAGLIALLFYPRYFRNFGKPVTWMWGLLLGMVNFGSIFFMIRALNYLAPSGNRIDSSVIFGANNIGIVALSVLVGLWVFREKLLLLNWLGILLSVGALLLFALG
jgi:drug/metabolite transporter (DMT)-like permease